MFTVGIDLGTTATVVAAMQNGVPQVISIDGGRKSVPSVVNYENNREKGFSEFAAIVGRAALSKVSDFSNTIFSIKRSMGTSNKFLGKTPEEISAAILSFVKETVERKTGNIVENAVITVPAHFSDAQRMATKRAASLAGIKVLRLINEPTSAAIAFGLAEKTNGIYAVYDFGGGTFDFSVLRLSDGLFQVLATGGDNYLGGDDIDRNILRNNLEKSGLDAEEIPESEMLIAKLVAKNMKEQCDSRKSGIIKEKCVISGHEYSFELSPEMLKDISQKYIDRTFKISEQVLNDAKLSHQNLDGVLLVGGMTKLQLVKDSVKNHFGVNVLDNVDPEEVVALGAAIQADSIANKNKNTLLIDVVPLTLGIETFGGGVDRIVHRNTPIPAIATCEYTTYSDDQDAIKFHVVQGERALAKDCRSIANFELKLKKSGNARPKIEVKFSVDINGLLSVRATEKNTGVEQNITVEPSSGLTENEMLSMLESAVKNRTKDREKSAYISAKMSAERQISFWKSIIDDIPDPEKNQIDSLILQLENMISDDGEGEGIGQKIYNLISDIDEIVGRFLDDIIKERLRRNPVKIA